MIETTHLTTEIILMHPRQILGNIELDWTPQPGNYLNLQGQTYAVLERRHRYQLKSGRYRLHKIALYVQSAPKIEETSLVDGKLVIGNVTCRFNARNELIRCAVNPHGPCDNCPFYEKLTNLN